MQEPSGGKGPKEPQGGLEQSQHKGRIIVEIRKVKETKTRKALNIGRALTLL